MQKEEAPNKGSIGGNILQVLNNLGAAPQPIGEDGKHRISEIFTKELGATSPIDILVTKIKEQIALKMLDTDSIPTPLVPGLFLGSIGSALNQKELLNNKITHILIVANGLNQIYHEVYIYIYIDIEIYI